MPFQGQFPAANQPFECARSQVGNYFPAGVDGLRVERAGMLGDETASPSADPPGDVFQPDEVAGSIGGVDHQVFDHALPFNVPAVCKSRPDAGQFTPGVDFRVGGFFPGGIRESGFGVHFPS